MEPILIIGIAVALLFNFLNGLHDAANSISTIVATRVLTPIQAVALAAFFNLIGPLFFTTAIAKTIGKGIIVPGWLTLEVIIIGILVASFWIYFTAYIGVPISSTHAMIGGAAKIRQDCPPYMVTESYGQETRVLGPNIVGLQRRGFSSEVRSALKEAYKLIYREGLNRTQALERVKYEVPDFPEVKTLIEFYQNSKRGVL